MADFREKKNSAGKQAIRNSGCAEAATNLPRADGSAADAPPSSSWRCRSRKPWWRPERKKRQRKRTGRSHREEVAGEKTGTYERLEKREDERAATRKRDAQHGRQTTEKNPAGLRRRESERDARDPGTPWGRSETSDRNAVYPWENTKPFRLSFSDGKSFHAQVLRAYLLILLFPNRMQPRRFPVLSSDASARRKTREKRKKRNV
ncbi:hypothetical protein TGMAS_415560 [Toxoplasma gondii MAS]|uniref:Uncharacterized protein n=1 Tax=Toxoplasma gondii MAS TaxID=943118 RepID=A0A086Q916_TOXGO|nr:hypothetical protein TGMAS_415560 [Toxoplasma gondii MAS]